MDVDQTNAASADLPFDEAWYLRQYPEIAAAVRTGGFQSGWEHYDLWGRIEERLPIPFDEAGYLREYPAIAEAVRTGRVKSGWEHYRLYGRFEDRMPVPPTADPAPADGILAPPYDEHNGTRFLVPEDLTVSPARLNRIALIGSCMAEVWSFHERNPGNCPVDLIVVNNLARLPKLAPAVVMSYDFAVIQIPLSAVIGNEAVWRFAYADDAAYEQEFHSACDRLEFHLNNWMEWNDAFGLLTFVVNFLAPQQNLMGRLFPRYHLSNPEYFISRLNQHLETLVLRKRNAYILNLDQLSASVGRRYMQDDAVTLSSHNGLLGLGPFGSDRIEPMAPLVDHYDIKWNGVLPELVWAEMMAMYRTVRQSDPVKVVVVDLDDTLWHGVSGDMDSFDGTMVAGWPIGIAEALMYLKKRGILLAIASKNDEARIRDVWPRIFSNRLHLEDFAAIRINWRPKAENMREILEGMNLLPRNAVFIDDNPAEREAMQLVFPEMRILGRHPLYLRRVLLWSSETQVAVVTEESSRRTEMIQAQFTRETQRASMSRETFLRDASPKITMLLVDGTGHDRFARVFELINKTNQFNTTGRRWKIEECEAFFKTGGQLMAFEVTDRFTSYGLVGVVMFRSTHIEQWVMSCRVLGYQIEEAVMATIVAAMRQHQPGAITGRLIHTDVNFPCRELFPSCGFTENDEMGNWVLAPETAMAIPDHVTIT